MSNQRFVSGVLFICILFVFNQAAFTSAAPPVQERPIRVVTKEIVPFVIKEDGRLTGFSIDLWKEVALLADLDFEFVEVATVGEQLDALAQGEADLAIAAISMTPERELHYDFSYPYFQAGLQILTRQENPNPFVSLARIFFSPRLLAVVGVLLFLLILMGHLVWFAERKHNPHFPKSYLAGVWEGLWWASATVTTVGYGDRTVQAKWGRVLGIFWMFVGLVLIANFTAVVTTELTLNDLNASIRTVDDLYGKRVATVTGTTSERFLRENRIPVLQVVTIDEAYTQLENAQIEAVVYDAPVLQYYVATSSNPDLLLVGAPFNFEEYGIAFPPDSPLEESVNQALLELKTNGTYNEIVHRWSLTVQD